MGDRDAMTFDNALLRLGERMLMAALVATQNLVFEPLSTVYKEAAVSCPAVSVVTTPWQEPFPGHHGRYQELLIKTRKEEKCCLATAVCTCAEALQGSHYCYLHGTKTCSVLVRKQFWEST